ncbi:MAG: DUF6600 domain-containing protein [Polyangiales bacterium]
MRVRSLLLVVLLAATGCYVRAESGVRVVATTAVDTEPLDEDVGAIAFFEPTLSPYGVFVDDDTWGTVWVPNAEIVGPDFQPYVTAGHWAYTDEGYYWVSDYSWGWAPFHHGRWVWTSTYGWVWIAGRRYSPAWVEWREGDGYIGWGPMPPHWCHRHGVVVFVAPPPPPFVFVASVSFFAPHPHTVIVGPEEAPGIMGRTHRWAPPSPIVGAKPFAGPDPHAVGIPKSHLDGAHIVAPPKPESTWKPTPKTPPVAMPPPQKPPVVTPPPQKPKPKPPAPIKPKVPPLKAPS